jgi:hypothetical protein
MAILAIGRQKLLHQLSRQLQQRSRVVSWTSILLL